MGKRARYQYNVPVPNVVVTTVAAEGMEVCIEFSREWQAVHVYAMGHWHGEPEIKWKYKCTWGEPLHAEVFKGPGTAEGENAAELSRAEQEKEKRQRKAAAEGLDILGDGRDRRYMLQRWAQKLRGKASQWQNVLKENREAQPAPEERIEGGRAEDVRRQ